MGALFINYLATKTRFINYSIQEYFDEGWSDMMCCDAIQQFVNGIIIRLKCLLAIKEEEHSAGISSKWLLKKATKLKTIKEYLSIVLVNCVCQLCLSILFGV